MDASRGIGGFFLAVCLAVFAAWLVAGCDKAEAPTVAPAASHPAPAAPAASPAVTTTPANLRGIPQNALRYRSELIRNARSAWGLDAPVATFAGQVHQESGWRPQVKSPVGAQGMAQFMPATSAWIAKLYPELAANEPFNPSWALRALVTYDRYLWDRVHAATPCDRMAMTLSAYNGGLGWVRRDARLASGQGLAQDRWWDNIETVNAGRSAGNWRENRGYPRRILRLLSPRYVAAGFGGGLCHD
ncbi:transglycosylase SLT domain-containing protein [Desulfovibrio sp. JY]|nr:transglycosylase SLT domain-containing protein [Desulfovibrio sp. JY]